MKAIGPEPLSHRVRLHVLRVVEAYGGVPELAEVSCVHGGHADETEQWACVTAILLEDFLKERTNRDAVLTALVDAQSRT